MNNDKSKILDIRQSAMLVSAIPLTQTEKQEIENILKSNLGRDVNLQSKVDKNVIAGIYLRVGDKVIDATLKTKIDKLREELLQ